MGCFPLHFGPCPGTLAPHRSRSRGPCLSSVLPPRFNREPEYEGGAKIVSTGPKWSKCPEQAPNWSTDAPTWSNGVGGGATEVRAGARTRRRGAKASAEVRRLYGLEQRRAEVEQRRRRRYDGCASWSRGGLTGSKAGSTGSKGARTVLAPVRTAFASRQYSGLTSNGSRSTEVEQGRAGIHSARRASDCAHGGYRSATAALAAATSCRTDSSTSGS